MPKLIPYPALKPDEWPSQIRCVLELRQAPKDPFRKINAAESWRPGTFHLHVWNVGYFLGWLQWSSRFDPMASLAEAATPETLIVYVDDMRAWRLSPRTIAARLTGIRAVLAALSPDLDVTWLVRGIDRLNSEPSDRRQTLQRSQHTRHLVELGMTLIRSALIHPLDGPQHDQAIAYRDGLIIVFLALVVPRIGTMPVMMLEKHLVQSGPTYKVKWEGMEMKGGRRAYQAALPVELGTLIHRYIEAYRPVLAGRSKGASAMGAEAVWLNKHGNQMSGRSLYNMIIARTKAAFGATVYPHAFRHSAATSLVLERPDLVKLVTPLLQHHTASMRNTYILGERMEATLRYGEALAARRKRRHRSQAAGDGASGAI